MERRDFADVSSRLGKAVDDLRERRAEPRNVQAVMQQIEAIARGDLEAAISGAHADIEFEIFAPPEFPWIRKARGVAALREAIAHNFASVVDQRPEVTSVTAQGDTVVLLGREQGRLRETGASYAMEFVHRFQFREGRLASIKIIAARA